MEEKPAKVEMWAVWPYDQPPYYLSGRVTHYLSEGKVQVEGYTGMRFTPVALVPGEQGRRLHIYLKGAENELRQHRQAFTNAVRAVLAEGLSNRGLTHAERLTRPGFQGAGYQALLRDALDQRLKLGEESGENRQLYPSRAPSCDGCYGRRRARFSRNGLGVCWICALPNPIREILYTIFGGAYPTTKKEEGKP